MVPGFSGLRKEADTQCGAFPVVSGLSLRYSTSTKRRFIEISRELVEKGAHRLEDRLLAILVAEWSQREIRTASHRPTHQVKTLGDELQNGKYYREALHLQYNALTLP